MKIFETTDYEIFKYIKGNRPVDLAKVDRLCTSVDQKNLLSSNPVIVNGQMEIVDGQHRVEAAKKLKLPVFYIVVEDADFRDVSLLNTYRFGFTLHDYLCMYAAQGDQNYRGLLKFLNDTGLTFSQAMPFFLRGKTSKTTMSFRKGEFEFDQTNTERIYGFYKRIVGFVNKKSLRPKSETAFIKSTRFTAGCSFFFRSHGKQIDESLFFEHLGVKLEAFCKRGTEREYYKSLLSIYNFGLWEKSGKIIEEVPVTGRGRTPKKRAGEQ